MKISELFESINADEFEPITISDNGDGKFTIRTTAKRGPTLDVIIAIYLAIYRRKDIIINSLSGKLLTIDRVYSNKPNGFVVVFSKTGDNKAELEKKLEDAKQKVKKQMAADVKYKAAAPERKKQAAAGYAERRKEDIAAYDKLYGKGTWNRVKYKQEGGDDGYQYVVRVDGRPLVAGLTLRSAEYEKLKAVKAIAKKEKLGQFAEND